MCVKLEECEQSEKHIVYRRWNVSCALPQGKKEKDKKGYMCMVCDELCYNKEPDGGRKGDYSSGKHWNWRWVPFVVDKVGDSSIGGIDLYYLLKWCEFCL